MEINDVTYHVRDFMQKAGQKTPTVLTNPSEDERILRAKLILEEAMELIERGLGIEVSLNEYILESSKLAYKIVSEPDVVEAMDGAADLMWVGVAGVAVVFGCNLEPVLQEVSRSNNSKFIDGHRREDGKWQKGPSYSPADIKSVLENIKI
jgi:predicted HAD superfamily Cof-like phosphohydrolase